MHSSLLRVHGTESCSLANGPGKRAVVWVQGCSIRCAHCWNPETQDPEKAKSFWDPSTLAKDLLSSGRKDRVLGLTISGGEPLDQDSLIEKLISSWKSLAWNEYHSYKSLCVDVDAPTVILFSGYRITHEKWRGSSAQGIWDACDVIIAGPYTRTPRGLLPGYEMSSCETQITYNLTGRIKAAALWQIPRAEYIIDRDGKTILTGTDDSLFEDKK